MERSLYMSGRDLVTGACEVACFGCFAICLLFVDVVAEIRS